jgi:hypothetical protein
MKFLFTFAVTFSLGLRAFAQSPGVPIYNPAREARQFSDTTNAAQQLRLSGKAVGLAAVKEQLQRTSCTLTLPSPGQSALTGRQVWERARAAHVRIGWFYLCPRCDDWHLNLAGGYALTSDGAVATCHHVVRPGREIRDGCLVAADDEGKLFPVTEVLAANRRADVCIVRVAGANFKPLPLSTNVSPGDTAYCLSDPLEEHGYFSKGIVNNFSQVPARRRRNSRNGEDRAPVLMNVSTDWAPGSSGSAVLDEHGNAIGHVSTISAETDEPPKDTKAKAEAPGTLIVFHEAVSAREVLALIQPPK